MDSVENRQIAGDYAEFLASCYKWDYFGNLTLHPEWSGSGARIVQGQVHRFFWLLFHLAAIRAGGAFEVPDAKGRKRFQGPLATAYRKKRGRFVYVFAIEAQRRGALHAHFLLYVPSYFDHYLNFNDVRKAWPYGGNKIERPRVQADVNIYVSKYIAKEGEIELSESFESNRLGRCHLHRPSAA